MPIGPIDIKKYKKKDIANAVFLGNEPIDGYDYEEGERYCHEDLGENDKEKSSK